MRIPKLREISTDVAVLGLQNTSFSHAAATQGSIGPMPRRAPYTHATEPWSSVRVEEKMAWAGTDRRQRPLPISDG
jgi:hypothetical protein